MKKSLILTLFFLLTTPSLYAAEVVALMRYDVGPYHRVLEGFQKGCNCTVEKLIVPPKEDPALWQKIRGSHPSMILAVGEAAFTRAVKYAGDIPVVHTFVSYPWQIIPENKTNIMGVPLLVPPEVTLARFLKISPWSKRIGLVYDPEESTRMVNEIRIAAGKLGMELVALELKDPREAPDLFWSLAGKVDAYWMLPDPTVFSPASVEILVDFSKENRIPIITFNDSFVLKGALMALSTQDFEMGLQAGKMANKLLAGFPMKEIPRLFARKTVLSFNKRIAAIMGVTPSKTMLAEAGNVIYLFENF